MSIPDPSAPRLKAGDRVCGMDGRDGTIQNTFEASGGFPYAVVHWDTGGTESVLWGYLEKRPSAYAPPEQRGTT